MDHDELRSILRSSGSDLWTLIDAAISVASSDHPSELRLRRDGFVERLYAPAPNQVPITRNNHISNNNVEVINNGVGEEEKGSSSPIEKVFGSSPFTPQSNCRDEVVEEDEEVDIEGDDCIDQERKILAIRNFLEDPDQSNDYVAGLLQSLADMNITFRVLRDTDIGRHVNRLRKHSSTEVRRLVKQLVRKWKEIVDEWVKNNPENVSPTNNNTADDTESPQEIPSKHNQNGNRVTESTYSPDLHNGRMSCNRNSLEPNSTSALKRGAPFNPINSTPASAPRAMMEQKDNLLDTQRLANARKRLAENYQEAQNAKKQRTIQVMDIHDIPKPKNAFIARNKGGNGQQAKRW